MGSGSGRLAIIIGGDDTRHLGVSGELDSSTAPDLDAALAALGPEADVVIDLSGCPSSTPRAYGC
jgi:anti-anti-sigma regulatory factor